MFWRNTSWVSSQTACSRKGLENFTEQLPPSEPSLFLPPLGTALATSTSLRASLIYVKSWQTPVSNRTQRGPENRCWPETPVPAAQSPRSAWALCCAPSPSPAATRLTPSPAGPEAAAASEPPSDRLDPSPSCQSAPCLSRPVCSCPAPSKQTDSFGPQLFPDIGSTLDVLSP